MNPVRLAVIKEKQNRAQGPCQGISPEDRVDDRENADSDRDVGHTDNAPAAEHDEHRYSCLACAPHDACDAVGKRQQEIKQRNRMRLQRSVSDDLRVAVECGDQVGGQEIDADTDDFRKGDGAEDAEACASFGTVILLCAEVLADKSSQCQRKTGDR